MSSNENLLDLLGMDRMVTRASESAMAQRPGVSEDARRRVQKWHDAEVRTARKAAARPTSFKR